MECVVKNSQPVYEQRVPELEQQRWRQNAWFGLGRRMEWCFGQHVGQRVRQRVTCTASRRKLLFMGKYHQVANLHCLHFGSLVDKSLHRHQQQQLQHRLPLRPQLRRTQVLQRLVLWALEALVCTRSRHQASRPRMMMIRVSNHLVIQSDILGCFQHLHGYWIQPSRTRR